MAAKSAEGPRERLLAAAQDLFYSRGAGVGVDALRKETNVARRSLDELVSRADFRGCRYVATDLPFAEPGHPAPAETETFRRRLHGLPVRESEALGHTDRKRAVEQLHLLIEGTLVRGASEDGRHPARAARDLAAVVLDEA